MKDLVIIDGQAAAAAFASPQQRGIIQTLIGAELTLGALSRAIRLPLNLLHYHVAKCVSLGLVEVVGEEQRAGRAMKRYRATASTFFVPAELVAELPGSAYTRQLRDRLDWNLARSLKGIAFTHDGQRPRGHLVKESPEQSAALELWLDAGLSGADADELAAEMQALMDRFRARANETEPRHLVHLALVKL